MIMTMEQRKFKILLLDDAPYHREEYSTAIKKIFKAPLNAGYECDVVAVEDGKHFRLAVSGLAPNDKFYLAIVDQKILRWIKVGDKYEEVMGSDSELEQGPDIVKKFARH